MTLEEALKRQLTIVFVDGECAICNRLAQFIMKHDQSEDIYLATLQSEMGRQACQQTGQDSKNLDTVVYLDQGVFYSQSTAALRICLKFGPLWRVVAHLGLAVPRSLRDFIYQFVAKNRHRFRHKISCPRPTAGQRQRTLSE